MPEAAIHILINVAGLVLGVGVFVLGGLILPLNGSLWVRFVGFALKGCGVVVACFFVTTLVATVYTVFFGFDPESIR
jgi:hypothetical protein